MYSDITYDVDDGIATIRFDRPHVSNAFIQRTLTELFEAIGTARTDDRVYVIVLTGSDGSFCAGADINEMPQWDEEMSKGEFAAYLGNVQEIVFQLRDVPKPTIAAVDGPAIGAGCDFALACDFRILGTDAILREGFVRVGLVPGDGGGWLLPRLIGEAQAKEYLLTGKDITSSEAVEMGLAMRTVADPLSESLALAAEITALPTMAVRYTKQLINSHISLSNHCDQAIEYQWECINDPEHKEAVKAFTENRKPEYDRPGVTDGANE